MDPQESQAPQSKYTLVPPSGGAAPSSQPQQTSTPAASPTGGTVPQSKYTLVPPSGSNGSQSGSTDDGGSFGENLANGAAKGFDSTMLGAEKGIRAIPGVGPWLGQHAGLDEQIQHDTPIANQQTHGVGGAVGYGGETLMEFMMGDEALKGLSVADRALAAGKTLKIVEKSPRLMQALKLGSSQIAKGAARAGVVQAGQTLARTQGDVGESLKEGAEGAATAGVVGSALHGLGALATKAGVAGKTAGELADTAANAPDKQTIVENIQGQLQNSKKALHENYESGINDLEGRLQGSKIDPKTAPIAQKAQDILQKPNPEDHPSVAQLKEIRGEKLDAPVREFLENTAEGKQSLSQEDIDAADEANSSKPKLLDAQGNPAQTEDVEPEAKDLPPHDAHSLIQWRQQVRALASEYPAGDVNARALNRLLYDNADKSSAFDDTFSQLADQSGDAKAASDYQALRGDYRSKIGVYDNPVIKNLMEGKADDAAKAFVGFNSASGKPVAGKTAFNVDQLHTILGDEGFNHFRNSVYENMMQNATDGSGDKAVFNPAKFVNTLSNVAKGTNEDFFGTGNAPEIGPKNYLDSLTTDAKSAAAAQKLVRYGLIAGPGAAISSVAPTVGGLGTVLGFILGHEGAGGIAKGRQLLDYVANNPKTWALLRKMPALAESAGAKAAASTVKAGAQGVVGSNAPTAQDNSDQYGSASEALGGKPLTAPIEDPANASATPPSGDSDGVMAATKAVDQLPDQVRNAVSTIPVGIKAGSAQDDPNGRASNGIVSSVNSGAGNNDITIHNAKALNDQNPVAITGHEVTHVWQNNLPPSVQAKIPDDPKDMSAFDISDVDKLRKQGKTMVDIPREKSATIVQKYIEAKPGSATRKKLQPWINDMGNTPLSSTQPTAPNAKGLNMTPRAPGLPPSTVAGMSGVRKTLGGK